MDADLIAVIRDRVSVEQVATGSKDPNVKAWWRAGVIEQAITGAAAAVPTMADAPTLRLTLAREVTGREIDSYKDLKEHEIQAIYAVVSSRGLLLREWVRDKCGTQLTLEL
jgi:hypothetical protein